MIYPAITATQSPLKLKNRKKRPRDGGANLTSLDDA